MASSSAEWVRPDEVDAFGIFNRSGPGRRDFIEALHNDVRQAFEVRQYPGDAPVLRDVSRVTHDAAAQGIVRKRDVRVAVMPDGGWQLDAAHDRSAHTCDTDVNTFAYSVEASFTGPSDGVFVTLDLISWAIPTTSLLDWAKDFTIANWFWYIKPLLSGFFTIQLTNPPHIVRLIGWDQGSGCIGADGAQRSERKDRLVRALAAKPSSKLVFPRSHTGVIAIVQQAVWGQDLMDSLIESNELYVNLVVVNQKAAVYVDGMHITNKDDVLGRLGELPYALDYTNGIGSVRRNNVPAGVLDFGWDVPDQYIIAHKAGTRYAQGWGSGEVFPMFGCANVGSVSMNRLPEDVRHCTSENAEVTRIIRYPLLVHALKNATQLAWKRIPKTIFEARSKVIALENLTERLKACQHIGGTRTEVRMTGHGNPKIWIDDFVSMMRGFRDFDIQHTSVKIPIAWYLDMIERKVAELSAIVVGRNNTILDSSHPICRRYKHVVQCFGFSIVRELETDVADKREGDTNDGETNDDEEVEIERRVARRTRNRLSDAAPRDPPCDHSGTPYEEWTDLSKTIWQLVPHRVLFMKFGRGRLSWWARRFTKGKLVMLCNAANAEDAIDKYVAAADSAGIPYGQF